MTATDRHVIAFAPHGADCSCGRTFSLWSFKTSRPKALYATQFRNLARANAARHADAANRKGA